MLKTEPTLSIILEHLIVTKYASQNSTNGYLCHLSNKFVDKIIKTLEYYLYVTIAAETLLSAQNKFFCLFFLCRKERISAYTRR